MGQSNNPLAKSTLKVFQLFKGSASQIQHRQHTCVHNRSRRKRVQFPSKNSYEPNEKNAFWALEMFSVMDFIGLNSEVHQVPRRLEAVVGSKVAEPTSSWTFFGILPWECITCSHFCVFICRKFSARKSLIIVAWVLLDWGSHMSDFEYHRHDPGSPRTHPPELLQR